MNVKISVKMVTSSLQYMDFHWIYCGFFWEWRIILLILKNYIFSNTMCNILGNSLTGHIFAKTVPGSLKCLVCLKKQIVFTIRISTGKHYMGDMVKLSNLVYCEKQIWINPPPLILQKISVTNVNVVFFSYCIVVWAYKNSYSIYTYELKESGCIKSILWTGFEYLLENTFLWYICILWLLELLSNLNKMYFCQMLIKVSHLWSVKGIGPIFFIKNGLKKKIQKKL
jgi:hypothetical protein